jgi:uncharacterized membrane protein YkgB
MNPFIKKLDSLIEKLASSPAFKSDFDYHLVRGSMVFVFPMFGYQKWFEYEAQTLIPFIQNGPAWCAGQWLPRRFVRAIQGRYVR